MLDDTYVSFDAAKLLKSFGFNAPCIYAWKEEKNAKNYVYCTENEDGVVKCNSELVANYDENGECYSAPTLQRALAWLRERDIDIEIRTVYKDGRRQYAPCFTTKKHLENDEKPFCLLKQKDENSEPQYCSTWEEAVNDAQIYVLQHYKELASVL